jgi:hypothetical protein
LLVLQLPLLLHLLPSLLPLLLLLFQLQSLLHLLLLLLPLMLYHLRCVHLHQPLTWLQHLLRLLRLLLLRPCQRQLSRLHLLRPFQRQLLQPQHHELPDMMHHNLVPQESDQAQGYLVLKAY